jgi:hypothetical protein
MSDEWPEISYHQALAAHNAGQKLHRGGRVFLVRPALRNDHGLDRSAAPSPLSAKPVLWVVDQFTTGDHGLLIYPDGQTVQK